MNEKNIISALNSLDDRFLLEASPVSGRGIHLSKKAAALLIAAAVAAGASVTAAAVHHFRIGKSVTQLYTGDISESDIDKLSSTTEAWRGSIINETFKDVDFTVDCVTHDLYTDHIWITAAKTDGSGFECEEGDTYFLALDFEYYHNLSSGRDYDPETEGIYWTNNRLITCTPQEDGTLSIKLDVESFDEPLEGIYTGFGDIIKIHDPYHEKWIADEEETERFFGSLYDKRLELQINHMDIKLREDTEASPESYIHILMCHERDDERFDDIKARYDKWLSEYIDMYTSYTDEIYKGELILKTDTVQKDFIKINDEERDISLSAINLDARLPQEVFESINGLEYDMTLGETKFYTGAEVTFTYKDGSSELISSGRDTDENGNEFDYSVISLEPDTDGSVMHISLTFERPVDPYEVAAVSVNGTDIMTFE